MTDTNSGQSSQTIAGGGDPKDREIARLNAELIRTKEKLLLALDSAAGAEAETAEAKGKALEHFRELQARESDIHKMRTLVPELQFQADAAHRDLDEIRSSRSFQLMLAVLSPYRKARGLLER